MRVEDKEYVEDVPLVGKLKLLEKAINLITKYGYKKVLTALFVISMIAVGTIAFINQKTIIEDIIREQKQANQLNEAKKINFRVSEVNPRVDAILYKLMANTNADRTFVLEMHNGTDNPSGLPFAFCDMTYERVLGDLTKPVIDEYQKVNLSSFTFPQYLIRNKKYFGTVDNFIKIDRKIGNRIKDNGGIFIGIYPITSSNLEIGWVGITYKNKPPKNESSAEGYLLDASQKLSILLDISKNVELK
jgi:hypothetical protein